jgi:hypothetical protein
MKALALLSLVSGLLSGCSLYFDKDDPGHGSGPAPWPVDAGTRVDAYPYPPPPPPLDAGFPGSSETMARCEDGLLRAAPAPLFAEEQRHGTGDLIGRCAGACSSAAYICKDRTCQEAAEVLCDAPISLGATCSLNGQRCQDTEVINCPEVTACSEALPGSTCSCVEGAYRCEQVTSAAEIQAGIVGKWSGTVVPANFGVPYEISLWIYPDGSYWSESTNPLGSAFYYGGDGPSPERKIKILSASDELGAWADIAIDFGTSFPSTGTLTGLVVDDTSLRFTFSPSWNGCGDPFDFELRRDRN